MDSSSLRPFADANFLHSPSIDHHDSTRDTRTSASFFERFELCGADGDRGKRVTSDTFSRPRDMVSSPLWHSSKGLPPLSLPITPRHDIGVDAGIRNDPQHNKKSSILLSQRRLTTIVYNTKARMHSSQFPEGHQLNQNFVQTYQLEDELGSGGYGFVMTAYHRTEGHEVAVKFIIKDKVPEHGWMENDIVGRLPAEVVLLSLIQHDNIVKCLGLFEDPFYFYLVQELHGSPWYKYHKLSCQLTPIAPNSTLCPYLSTPSLSPSTSEASLPASEPGTPPHMFTKVKADMIQDDDSETSSIASGSDIPKLLHTQLSISQNSQPSITRRPSHDLFECIEQSENKRLTEHQARYVFSQIVDAVDYLDKQGISHRDIKDENLVIDKNLKVKLIDFGSAIAVNPAEPRPFYKLFYGTAAYASSEILLKKSYQAAPAEIWTLGVLLSYLVAGVSPFPSVRDAVDGKLFLSEKVAGHISDQAMNLMQRCLDPNPETRATISQVKEHHWLRQSHLTLQDEISS